MVDAGLLQLSIDPQQLGIELGTGAVVGGIVGFAAKKVAKLIAILVGLELALFKFLESRGFISVNWEQFGGVVSEIMAAGQGSTPPSWIDTILSTLSVSAGFTGGFMIGFRRG